LCGQSSVGSGYQFVGGPSHQFVDAGGIADQSAPMKITDPYTTTIDPKMFSTTMWSC
jgi:hypothetical protein